MPETRREPARAWLGHQPFKPARLPIPPLRFGEVTSALHSIMGIAAGRCQDIRFADAAHAVHADTSGRSGDDDPPIEVGAQRVSQGRQGIGPRIKVRRQRRHADQFAEQWLRLRELADQVLPVRVILPIVAKTPTADMAEIPDSKSGPRKRVWVQVAPSVLTATAKRSA